MTFPHSSSCRCGEPVLMALIGGEPIALDPIAILPLGKCETCKGKGSIRFRSARVSDLGRRPATCAPGDLYGAVLTTKTRTTCPDCLGSGQQGEEPDETHVLLNAIHGTVRLPSGRRLWESFHRFHVCQELLGAEQTQVSRGPTGAQANRAETGAA